MSQIIRFSAATRVALNLVGTDRLTCKFVMSKIPSRFEDLLGLPFTDPESEEPAEIVRVVENLKAATLAPMNVWALARAEYNLASFSCEPYKRNGIKLSFRFGLKNPRKVSERIAWVANLPFRESWTYLHARYLDGVPTLVAIDPIHPRAEASAELRLTGSQILIYNLKPPFG